MAEEVLQTAAEAAKLILSDNYEDAKPMVEAIATTLDVRGDLQRRVNIALDTTSLKTNRWYDSVVAEHFDGKKIDIPMPNLDEDFSGESVKAGIEELTSLFEKELVKASAALQEKRNESLDTNILDAVRSVVEDVKRALRVLRNTNKDDEEESLKVFSDIVEQAPRLVQSTRFVTQLVNSTGHEGADQ